MDDQEIIISLIENALNNKGWNRSRLARELKRTRGWASQLMKNQIKQVSARTVVEIARVLGIEPGALLPSSNNPAPSSATLEEFITRICEKVFDAKIELIKKSIK